jgi:hypothetical protein
MIQICFYEYLEQVFYRFPKYQTNNLLGDFTAKLKRSDICKPTTENESLLQDRNLLIFTYLLHGAESFLRI